MVFPAVNAFGNNFKRAVYDNFRKPLRLKKGLYARAFKKHVNRFHQRTPYTEEKSMLRGTMTVSISP
ncbi:Uncharacterised protein [Shigella sonnei]|nr:Uncharacterised protein [Shigella sonnei]